MVTQYSVSFGELFSNSSNQSLARVKMSRVKNLYMMLLLMEHVFSSNYRRFHEYVLTYMKWVSAHMSHCLLAAIITRLEFSLGRFTPTLENAKVFSSCIYSYVARFKLKNQRFLCGFKLNFHAQFFKTLWTVCSLSQGWPDLVRLGETAVSIRLSIASKFCIYLPQFSAR